MRVSIVDHRGALERGEEPTTRTVEVAGLAPEVAGELAAVVLGLPPAWPAPGLGGASLPEGRRRRRRDDLRRLTAPAPSSDRELVTFTAVARASRWRLPAQTLGSSDRELVTFTAVARASRWRLPAQTLVPR